VSAVSAVFLIVLVLGTAVIAIVTAHRAFTMLRADNVAPGTARGIAGGVFVATVGDIITIASALKLPFGTPGPYRIGGTILYVVLALAFAYFVYAQSGPTVPVPAPVGSPPGGMARSQRWGMAAGGFTGAMLVLAAVLQLLP
jgi:uncharacterized membrane protein YjfL (UPF0719 family)